MRPHEQPSATMPHKTPMVIAGAVALLLGVGAWVVDLSSSLQATGMAQAAADAGALAAAHNLLPPVDEATAVATAVSWVSRNGFHLEREDVRIWDHPTGRKAVTVTLTHHRGTLFGKRPVVVKASAALGGVATMPPGAIPLALPAYRDDSGQWWAHGSASHGDFRWLVADPARGGPTELWLSAGTPEAPGSALPLAVDGPLEQDYRRGLRAGARGPLAVGQSVPVLAGNWEAATVETLLERLDEGPDRAQVLLPLVDRAAAGQRPEAVTITGWAVARLSGFTSGGRIQAHYVEKVLPAKGVLEGGTGAGAHAPMLIENPQR